MRRRMIALLFFAGAALSASEYQDGQAARAVIGQPSFSARDKGVSAVSLSLARNILYVADTSGHLESYDVSKIGSARTPGCPVCLVGPQSTVAQSVLAGVAASAVNGRNVVVADAKTHRVMLWRGVSPAQKPDVVLSAFINPVSVALDNQRLFVGDAATHHVYVWNSLPATDGQPPDVTLGVPENGDGPTADSLLTPSALASDGANVFVADPAARRILVFAAGDLEMPQVLHAATLAAGPLAPGTLVSLDRGTASAAVFLNGNPLRVTEINGDKMQVQVPYELNNAMAGALWIEDGSGRKTRASAVRFALTSPGIFAFGVREPRTGLLLHAPGGVPLSPEDPAKPRELISVWATGLGAVAAEANNDGEFETLAPVRATLNGNSVEVLSHVLPAGSIGVYEVRLRLPASVPPGAALMLLQNESKSNLVTFPTKD